MHINVVTVKSGWILQKIAERIVAAGHPGVTFTLAHEADSHATANFYIDVYNCFHRPSGTLDVGFYTHLHDNNVRVLESSIPGLHFIVHMCQRYLDLFAAFYPRERMQVIHPGEIPPGFALKRPHIGIVQRGEYVGKGFHFMLDLATSPEVQNFQFSFVGGGWDAVVQRLIARGITARSYSDTDYSIYPSLYQGFDYLLVPSLWEGGPMSIFEAYGCGVPVIAADVGWLGRDFPVEHLFPPGDLYALRSILHGITAQLQARRDRVAYLSYAKYNAQLVSIVKGLRS